LLKKWPKLLRFFQKRIVPENRVYLRQSTLRQRRGELLHIRKGDELVRVHG
jgi:hypothetical protein